MVVIDKRLVELIANKTGLKIGTCLDLLSQGWTYVNPYGSRNGRWEIECASPAKSENS